MKYDQLLQLYFERSTALQNYWTLYVVVIGGLLAISNLRIRRDLVTVVLVTVLYSFFAFKNLGAIRDVTLQREAVVTAIQTYGEVPQEQSPTRQLVEPTLVHPAYGGIRNFHVACDVLVVLMLWAMERRRVKMAHDAV